MLRYILQRLGQSLLVMLGVSLLIFYSLHLTGDPAAVMMPPGSSQQEIANFRHSMGFDRSLSWQYWHYLSGVLHGNLGDSLRYSQPVTELIGQRVPATLLLALTALAWSTLVGLLLGIVSALYQDSVWDLFSRLLAFSGQAVPVFWLGLLLIIGFSLNLRWLPSSGYGSASQLVMPAISLGAYYMSAIARLIRASLIDVLQQDYIRTARQGAEPVADRGASRAAQCTYSGDHRAGDVLCLAAGRRAGNRDYLCLAGHWPTGGAGDSKP